MRINKWPKKTGERFLRCTGAAINCALALGQGFSVSGVQILAFLGGPCTFGPGKMAEISMATLMRSHVDLEKDSDKILLWTKAKDFYKSLTERAVRSNISLGVLAFSLDQNGFAEIKEMVQKTGGMAAMHR